MRLPLFSRKAPLDAVSIEWIFDVFAWALTHLDADYFYRDSILVTPTNNHFPGRAGSVREMAELIFDQTLGHAGMAHWPIQLHEPQAMHVDVAPPVALPAPLRARANDMPRRQSASVTIPVSYNPALVRNPEAMIAGYAQVLAHYLGATVNEAPPGGIQNWPQTTEVIGVFMGFGLLFANTAFNFKNRACGSCGGPPVERQVYLSQYDITYALALFSTLRAVPDKMVLHHLKSSLRPYFKRCRKDLAARGEVLAGLHAIAAPPPPAETPLRT